MGSFVINSRSMINDFHQNAKRTIFVEMPAEYTKNPLIRQVESIALLKQRFL